MSVVIGYLFLAKNSAPATIATTVLKYIHQLPTPPFLSLRYGTHDYDELQLNNCEIEGLIQKIKAIQNLIVKPDSSKIIILTIQ